MISETMSKEELNKLYSLADDELYNEINLEDNIDSWSDFLQPLIPNKSINEIKSIDYLTNEEGSYLVGFDFLSNPGNKYAYLDLFEDNFRKQLEDCDLIERVFFNVDFNSFWGGLNNYFISEYVVNEISKVNFNFLGIANDSMFFTKDEETNTNVIDCKKIINYMFYFADLMELQKTMQFMPININEDEDFLVNMLNMDKNINKEKNKNFKDENDERIKGKKKYLSTSLLGLDSYNMMTPYKSSKYNKTHNYLDRLNSNNTINFIRSDFSYNLDNSYIYGDSKNAGFFYTYNKNMIKSSNIMRFNWKKHFSYTMNFKNTSSCIANGYNEKFNFFSQPIDKYIQQLSAFKYSKIEKINTPFCFPKYTGNSLLINDELKFKNEFNNSSSICSIYSHDYLYCNNFISDKPDLITKNKFKIEKYLKTVDYSKFIELNDKVESLFPLFDFYDNFKAYEEDYDNESDY